MERQADESNKRLDRLITLIEAQQQELNRVQPKTETCAFTKSELASSCYRATAGGRRLLGAGSTVPHSDRDLQLLHVDHAVLELLRTLAVSLLHHPLRLLRRHVFATVEVLQHSGDLRLVEPAAMIRVVPLEAAGYQRLVAQQRAPGRDGLAHPVHLQLHILSASPCEVVDRQHVLNLRVRDDLVLHAGDRAC
eukprot:SAG31_NODE_1411_length_8466_cov_18.216565_5_plen_193_part_00